MIENQENEYIWFQRYRPKTIDECALPENLKKEFKAFITEGRVPNFLFSGPAGCGKTTTALALCNEIRANTMFINSSEESGIDILRNKIKSFASTISLTSSKKVVILDEGDYLSPAAAAALRGLMEEFSSNCSFIITCNFKSRIMDAIQSRCVCIDFKIESKDKLSIVKEFFKRCLFILKTENIAHDPKVVSELVMKNFPDFRRTINDLQSYSASGKIDSGILVNSGEALFSELFTSIKEKNFTEVRKWVGKNSDLEAAVLFRKVYDKADEFFVNESLPELIIILAEYQHKSALVVDQEINNMAFLTEVMKNCKLKG